MWNYRVVKLGGEFSFRDVYYYSDGSVKGWAEDAVTISGESVEDLELMLRLLSEALVKGVLELDQGLIAKGTRPQK
jgi:hypothetical protein